MNIDIVVRCCIFLVISCVHPLIIDTLKYNGAAEASTFLYVLPTYLGMILVGFMPTKQSLWDCDWKIGGAVAIGDIVHQLLEKAGLIYAGSGLYIVVGSTSIIWTAVLSRYYLNKEVTFFQWVGICLVALGLALRATMLEFSFSNNEFFGMLLVIVAAIMHALCYVVQEKLMTKKNPIEGTNLVCIMGCVNGGILLLWTLFYTVPRWDELVASRVHVQDGDWNIVFIAFSSLIIAAFARSTVLSWVLKNMGAISASVLKGIRPVVVFSLSHILFCATQESQCMSTPKFLTASVCSIGFFVFSASGTEPFENLEDYLRSVMGFQSLAESKQAMLKLKEQELRDMASNEENVALKSNAAIVGGESGKQD